MLNDKLCNPSVVANYFLEQAEESKVPITTMKLNKLVYFAYGWVLALIDEKLFDEPIQAWKYGPVVPSLYHEFKHFGSHPIEKGARTYEFDPFTDEMPIAPRFPKEKNVTREILDRVWDLYKDQSATTLMRLTHEKGAPWDQVYDKRQLNATISDDTIRTYFVEAIGRLVSNDRKK